MHRNGLRWQLKPDIPRAACPAVSMETAIDHLDVKYDLNIPSTPNYPPTRKGGGNIGFPCY